MNAYSARKLIRDHVGAKYVLDSYLRDIKTAALEENFYISCYFGKYKKGVRDYLIQKFKQLGYSLEENGENCYIIKW